MNYVGLELDLRDSGDVDQIHIHRHTIHMTVTATYRQRSSMRLKYGAIIKPEYMKLQRKAMSLIGADLFSSLEKNAQGNNVQFTKHTYSRAGNSFITSSCLMKVSCSSL